MENANATVYELSPNEVLLLKLRSNSLYVNFFEHFGRENVRKITPYQSSQKDVRRPMIRDESMINMIEYVLRMDYMFSFLDSEDRFRIARSMVRRETEPNEIVFKQGDRPKYFFAIEQGAYLVTVNDSQSRLIGPGQTFGDLAPIFNCTRSATIKSVGFGKLWVLSVEDFREAEVQVAQKRHDKVNAWLMRQLWMTSDTKKKGQKYLCEITGNADGPTLSELSRRLVLHHFPANSVIKCGSQLSTIFVVMDGYVKNHMYDDHDPKSRHVFGPGRWFEACRADEITDDKKRLVASSDGVTVLAMSHVELMSLSADSPYRQSILLELESESELPPLSKSSLQGTVASAMSSPEQTVLKKIDMQLKISYSRNTNSPCSDIRGEEKGDDGREFSSPLDRTSPPVICRRGIVPLQSQRRVISPAITPSLTISSSSDSGENVLSGDVNVTPHSESTISMLTSALHASEFSLLFDDLQDNELRAMVSKMSRRSYNAKDWIFRKRDATTELDCGLFVIESGRIHVTDETESDARTLRRGDMFGFAALMNASIHGKSAWVEECADVWFLKRDVFHSYRAISAGKRRQKIEAFVEGNKVLSMLPDGCVEDLVDSFVPHSFAPGTVVIREGDSGDVCYFLESGRVEVTREGSRLRELTEGSFFGELSLLNDEPRSASVTCLTHISCLVISRDAFEMLSSSMGNVIKRALSSPKIKRKSSFFATTVFMPETFGGKENMVELSQDDFHFIKCVGEGSYGQVVLVRNKRNHCAYAIKRVPRRKKRRRKRREDGEQSINATEPRELRILRKMNHQLVSRLVGTFDIGDTVFIVMPFYQGGDMFSMLTSRRKRRLGLSEAQFYVAEIHVALMFLHKHNVIYRDLKLENIVFDELGHVKLIDFGLAKLTEKGKRTFTICGTPEYMSPEMIKGKGYTKITDYWALGILLHELLVGFPPFGTREGSFQTGYLIANKIICKYAADRAKIIHQSPTQKARKGGGFEQSSIRKRRERKVLSLLPEIEKLKCREARDVVVHMLEPRAPLRLRGRSLEIHPFFSQAFERVTPPLSVGSEPEPTRGSERWWKHVRALKISPPWVPAISSDVDTRNFDEFDFCEPKNFFRDVS